MKKTVFAAIIIALTLYGCGVNNTVLPAAGSTEPQDLTLVEETPQSGEDVPSETEPSWEVYELTLPEEASESFESPSYNASEYTYVAEGSYYYDVASVVLYLDEYGELPDNYITKDEARDLGWQGGSVEQYLDGGAIGGDYFGNYEGSLPKNSYHECDIDTDGYKSRGSRRLIYSDDGKYYYTKDHYKTFTELTVPQCEAMLSVQ